ncbi:MAG: hypothetical protein ABMA64_33240 [Myxococcota bacterium]
MLALPLLVACSKDFSFEQDLATAPELPEMTPSCDADDVDETQGGMRVVSHVELGEHEGVAGCVGQVYASGPLIDWNEVRSEVDGLPGEISDWESAQATLTALSVHTADGQRAPAGTTLFATQLLVDEVQAQELESDPLGAMARVDSDLRPLRLMDFTAELTGDETDLVDAVQVTRIDPGPAAEIQDSYAANDESLFVVFVGSVVVPDEALEALPPTTLVVDLEENVAISATFKVRLW